MNKYINYINNKLTFQKLEDVKKNIKDLKILSLSNIKSLQIISYSHNNKLFKIKINNKFFDIFYLDLKDSGIKNENKKRILISKTNSILEKQKELIQPLCFYYSKNKICYIKFFSNNSFVWNDNDKNKKNRSVWIDFINIYACLKYSLNIKTEKYLISQDLEKIMINNKEFRNLSKYEYENIKKEIEDFEKNKIQIPKNLFNLKSKNAKNDIEKIGYITEELIFKLFKEKNTKIIEEKIKSKIKNFYWNNQKEESYLPYDFLINENIFLEVKGTIKNDFNFIMSENEWKFKNEKNENYFLINIRWENVENQKYSIKIYNYNELNKCKIIESKKYIVKDKKE